MTTDTARDAVERLGRADRALLTGHRRPDGDSLGSELAMAELARLLGTQTVIINHDLAPPTLADLPGAASVVVADSLPVDFPDGFDLVVTLECPTLDRAGFDGLDRRPILNIDHHPANPRYGDVNYLDEESPAVGEMVWRMFREAGLDPTPDAATNAYVALSTDTGDFRYSNATGRAFRAAAEMVDAGARPDVVAQWIHGRKNAPSVRLLGEALRTLEFAENGLVASLFVDEEAFRRAAANPEDTEEIINHPRAIDGVKAVVFFKQWEPGVVRVSLRSKGDVDVRRVAAQFEGGGHTNASGCTVNGSIEHAKEMVLEAAVAAVRNG
jgi:phosphoesterase RecJ-like protein